MNKLLLCLIALLCISPLHAADENPPQGTSAEEIASLKARPLPQPNKVKVAVLPFWDAAGSVEHVRMASSANWLLFQREGFQMVPILDSFKALAEDKKVEPGATLRSEDAIRIGKTLGVDFVVYGEVKELAVFKKNSVFKQSKNINAALRIAITEVPSESLLYWHSRREKSGGTGIQKGFQSKMDSLKRKACVVVSALALQPLFAAFPPHSVTDNTIESGDIAGFMDRTWPDKK